MTDAQKAEEARVEGATVYALNALGTNRWWASVQAGFDDDGKRITEGECEAVARQFAAASQSAAEVAALRAEVERLRKDAARWRMLQRLLRQPMTPMQPSYKLVEDHNFGEEEVDAERVVDAALAATQPKEPTP